MPMMEGTSRLKTWVGSYDFDVDAGATSTIVIRSNDGAIPNGSIITGGVLRVTAGFTTGTSATGAIQVNAANDIITAAIVSGAPWSTTGNKDTIPDSTGSTAVTTTASRQPSFLIGTGTVTAGAFTLILFYK